MASPHPLALAPCLCPPATNLHDTVSYKVQEEVKQAVAGLSQRDTLEKQTHVDSQVGEYQMLQQIATGCPLNTECHGKVGVGPGSSVTV